MGQYKMTRIKEMSNFLKFRDKRKTQIFQSFDSDKEIKLEAAKVNDNLTLIKHKNLYFKITNNRLYKAFIYIYIFFTIFHKDILYAYINKQYDVFSNMILAMLIIISITEIIINALVEKGYNLYFLFFDTISLILLVFDFSFFEEQFFYFFRYLIMGKQLIDIEHEDVFNIMQFFRLLSFIKIYKIITHFIKMYFKEEYSSYQKKNVQNVSEQIMTFTSKMHLWWISRYFSCVVFVLFSITLLQMITLPVGKNNSKKFFHNVNLLRFNEHEKIHEEEFLKSLYLHSVLKKNESEYIVAVLLKKPLIHFIEKKEINIDKEKIIFWDFSYLSKEQLLKFSNKNNINNTNVERLIILDNDIASLSDFRFCEIKLYQFPNFVFYINIKKVVQNNIKKIILFKVFIIIVSIIALIYFMNELNTVIIPLEGILKKLKLMKANPTLALEMQEDLLNHELKILKNKYEQRNTKGIYEILKIEENLMKLGTLMLLGFGEAGTKIISKNINEQERINLLINGEVVNAVFSFCDLRNFTEITEVLKEKILVFINLVAEIIHDCCDFYGGTVNKNIGDAFLLIWKCKKKRNYFENSKNFSNLKNLEKNEAEKENVEHEENEKFILKFLELSKKEYINRVCDLAFLSTVQTLIRLQKSVKIRSFLQNTQLTDSSFFHSPMKSIDLSFGLHFGWAIEGPIGSSYKIDLSYLSENVNIASRLQDISKVYKTNIIISEKFYQNMSDRFKKLLRQVDRATLKGCGTPMDLYTFDSCFDNICANEWDELETDNISEVVERYANHEKKRIKILKDIKKRKERKKRKMDIFNISYDLYDDYLKDSTAQSVKVSFPKEYLVLYENAMKQYLDGNWSEAKKHLELLKNNYQSIKDNIAEQLFQFMSLSNFEIPSDWCGFRKFLQK